MRGCQIQERKRGNKKQIVSSHSGQEFYVIYSIKVCEIIKVHCYIATSHATSGSCNNFFSVLSSLIPLRKSATSELMVLTDG